jgi:hypothetical protein
MRPAASVRSEPGSNSQVKLEIRFLGLILVIPFGIKFCVHPPLQEDVRLKYYIRIDVCLCGLILSRKRTFKAKAIRISYLVVKEQNFEGSQFVCFVVIVKTHPHRKPNLKKYEDFFRGAECYTVNAIDQNHRPYKPIFIVKLT